MLCSAARECVQRLSWSLQHLPFTPTGRPNVDRIKLRPTCTCNYRGLSESDVGRGICPAARPDKRSPRAAGYLQVQACAATPCFITPTRSFPQRRRFHPPLGLVQAKVLDLLTVTACWQAERALGQELILTRRLQDAYLQQQVLSCMPTLHQHSRQRGGAPVMMHVASATATP